MCNQFNDPASYHPRTQPAHSRDGLHRPIRGSHLRVPPHQITTRALEYIFRVSRCIPLYPAVSRCIPLYPAVSRCIPLYPAVSRCIPLYSPYPAVSRCIPLYPTVSRPRLLHYSTSTPGSRGSLEPFADTDTKAGTASETRSQLECGNGIHQSTVSTQQRARTSCWEPLCAGSEPWPLYRVF